MSTDAPSRKRKLLLRLGLAALAILAVGAFLMRGVSPIVSVGRGMALVERGMALITGMGPWVFFIAMALLPGVGVPSTVFTLTAGRAFGERMGMGAVVVAGVAATAANIALTYWLARGALRPSLARLLLRLGYAMPKVDRGDIADLVIILRTTPGIPLCVQNYLLGLADAPAGRYFSISYLLSCPSTAAYIWFGDALLHGKGRMILLALGLILALTAATHVLRRHYAVKKAAA